MKPLNEITTFSAALGWCAMLGRGTQLRRLTIGHSTATVALNWLMANCEEDARSSGWNRTLATRITAALEGEPDDFLDVEIDVAELTPFSRRVVAACRRISWGHTASYGELARRAGSAGAARAVGTVMSSNRTPLVVPCHRVIASGGKIGGFSAPQGIGLKRKLLALESAMPPACRR
jgi:methylated-DNA-[protein]-cysteine S-methyltransferase